MVIIYNKIINYDLIAFLHQSQYNHYFYLNLHFIHSSITYYYFKYNFQNLFLLIVLTVHQLYLVKHLLIY